MSEALEIIKELEEENDNPRKVLVSPAELRRLIAVEGAAEGMAKRLEIYRDYAEVIKNKPRLLGPEDIYEKDDAAALSTYRALVPAQVAQNEKSQS